MAVKFAAAKHPAPNLLFERMAVAMLRHLNASKINGEDVGGRCLGNVNDVFRSIGGNPRFLSPGFDQASDVAKHLRGRASTAPPPRGAICLWDNTGGGGADGHIAVADGNGNTVNNWSSNRVVSTPLARQRGGYVGWVSPALLGSGVSNGAKNTNPDVAAVDDTQTGDGGKRWPLPDPQDRPAWSALSAPMLWSGQLSLLGATVESGLAGLIDTVGLDAATGQVAQLTVTSHDPGLVLASSPLADIGSTLRWKSGGEESLWDISAVDVSAAATTVTVTARSLLAKRLRRRVRVRTARKVSPSEWVTSVVKGAGGRAIVQPSNLRGEIAQGDGVTEWEMISGLASDLGWSWVEWGGVVLFGSRLWAWTGASGRSRWTVTWCADEATDALDVSMSQTADDPESTQVGTVLLPWTRGSMVKPWDLVLLSGLGRWDGWMLVEQVVASTDRVSGVELQVSVPRYVAQDKAAPKSTKTATKDSSPPTRDKTSVQYAKWFARQEMAKPAYGWGSEDQWAALEQLWTRESGWNYKAENPSSGAYGIPQSLPGSKMASAGKDWRTNPETQIKWGLGYIKGRYGGPKRAWAHFQQRNWY